MPLSNDQNVLRRELRELNKELDTATGTKRISLSMAILHRKRRLDRNTITFGVGCAKTDIASQNAIIKRNPSPLECFMQSIIAIMPDVSAKSTLDAWDAINGDSAAWTISNVGASLPNFRQMDEV
jgi:hypothetical protein